MKWLVAFALASCCAAGQAEPVPASPAAATVPPTGRNVAVASDDCARMGVPVVIGGRSWQFLIDTASTRSVIASDVADSLGLARGKALNILTIAGIDTVPSVVIPELGFASFGTRGIAAPALVRGDIGGDGLLGLDILHRNLLTIDFRRATALTITPSSPAARLRQAVADPDAIVVTARSRMGELIVTDAEIDGIAVAVVIDTGAQDSIGNPALARMLLHRGRRHGGQPIGQATLISVTGRTVPADYALVGQLHIGGVTIDNVPMAFADVASFRQFRLVRRPAILLGMQTLRLFAQVTIDFPRRQISFLLPRSALARAGR